MTQLAKCVIETVNTSGTVTETRDERIVKSDVTRFGSRTVDTGTFWFNGRTKVDQNYNVKYIQDIVDTTRLAAIWNFQLTTKDEGGYDHDGTDLAETRFVNPNVGVNTKKFQAQYILDFDEATGTDHFEVTDDTRLDMTGQFDLYVWCQFSSALGSYASEDKAIIFSKYDGTNGGIEVGFIHKASGDKRLFVRTLDNIGSSVEREGTQAGFINNTPRLIRIKRDENNLVSCYLDGILELSFTEDFAYGQGENIRFGAHQHPTTPSEFWGGHIMQARLYTGDYLTDLEAERIHQASPQPLTMKLAGKVWKVSDNTSPIQVHVKGHGKTLIEANMTSNILSGTDTTPNRTTNVYDAGDDHSEIIADMIENVDSSFLYKDPSSATAATWSGKFVATGGLIQCIELLLVKTDGILYTTPRKIAVLEDADGFTTPYDFRQNDVATSNGHIITTSGKDDSLMINELEFIGRLRLKHKEEGLGSINTSGGDVVKTLAERPVQIIVTDGTQIGIPDTDYTIDYEAKEITFLAAWTFTDPSTITVKYEYEDVDSTSNDQLYFLNTTTGSSSVTEHGRFARRIFVPQLTHRTDLNTGSQKIIGDNSDVLTRYQVVSAGHINHMRENMKATLINAKKSINSAQVLKSINWKYPLMRTTMEFGEHRFDSFDLEKVSSRDVQSLNASTMNTQNA